MLQSLLMLLLTIQLVQVPADEIRSALAHAEALYYGARFNDAIQLLERIDDLLETKTDRQKERIETKLQLALAHIGLNDTAAAKLFLVEMYALDDNYILDPKQFSPKVVELAADAQAEQKKLLCQNASDRARRHIDASEMPAVLELLASMKSRCPDLSWAESEAADLAYKAGLDAYRREALGSALEHFQTTARLSPGHEMAAQYIDLTKAKLEVTEERLFMQWQKNFASRQWKQAAVEYKQLAALTGKGKTVGNMESEYRKSITPLVEAWNKNCPAGDEAAMTAIRTQIMDMLPEPSFAQDLRGKMISCTKASPIDLRAANQLSGKPAASRGGCVQMEPAQALVHLKTKVDPEVPRESRTYLQNSQVVVRVKVRIDESGNVTAGQAQGGSLMLNDAVRAAVVQWKFTPVRDPNGIRCVDTEIPINLGLRR